MTVAVVLAAALYLAGAITPRLRMPGDDSAEAGFARDMSIHHGQAVAMSLMVFAAPPLTDPKLADASSEIRAIALNITTGQQEQIGEMNAWLAGWHLSPNPSGPRMAWMPDGRARWSGGLMPGMASTAELDRLGTLRGPELYIYYCQLMLAGQQREITALPTLLSALDAQPLPA